MRKYVWYLKLLHPSGKKTIKKWYSNYKSPQGMEREFYGSAFHFNSEASIIRKSKKRSNL